MGKKLRFVDLPYSIANECVPANVGRHGSGVSADVIRDERCGWSKGFRFLERSSDARAQAATSRLGFPQYVGLTTVPTRSHPGGHVIQ